MLFTWHFISTIIYLKRTRGAEFMKMTFRWYGEKDGIPLRYIGQIPNMSGVVGA